MPDPKPPRKPRVPKDPKPPRKPRVPKDPKPPKNPGPVIKVEGPVRITFN